MYGGLFGDLPSTTKSLSKDGVSQDESDANKDVASPEDRDNQDPSSKKRPTSIVGTLGAAGTTMAFVPTALRQKKRALAPASTPKPPISIRSVPHPAASASAPENVANTSDPQLQIQQEVTESTHDALPLLEEETEQMRQLHASVMDAYDPHVPNDLLAYWDRKAMERERLELEREARETLQRQQHLRMQLEQEREAIQATGDVQRIAQHRAQLSMGRGRGRGLSNLPAWLVQQQKDTLGQNPANNEPMPTAVPNTNPVALVILSNLAAPGEIDDDLAAEVKEECEDQCGPVQSVIVRDAQPPDQPLVQVHVRFYLASDAEKAVHIFHGRKFGQRRITAQIEPPK